MRRCSVSGRALLIGLLCLIERDRAQDDETTKLCSYCETKRQRSTVYGSAHLRLRANGHPHTRTAHATMFGAFCR